MHVLMTGAAGMIGRKLTDRLLADGSLAGWPIERLTLVDLSAPQRPEKLAARVDALAADLTDPATARAAIAERPDVIFHLAAVVSGEAELDFEKGMRVNFDGSRALLDAIRIARGDYRPRFVFASSLAVFGAPFPEAIPDEFATTPLTSYGTQKAMIELLLADYTRRGFLDGVGIRLPSIVVRPGRPNKAASGFFSSIIREPLNGEEAVLPVDESVQHWHASPRAAIGFLVHAAGLERETIGPRVNLTMPGVCCTVAEQIAALRRIAGDSAASRIRREPDPLVARIVAGWPSRFEARRALALGFRADASFDKIIHIHIADELNGKIAR
ncbi:MAG TPA: D-erythronate dehydrogenase [Xanthobacteraceae bacterium]|nr:D-erythronate dehydrogenase [Xanthobacteraceae bacterium]